MPYVGLAAFSLVLPITYVILGVLVLVTLSYREVVMVYTKAGGSYVVARDNFGVKVAQIAAVALLIDYTVTVAVQTAAGTNALTSAVPSLVRYQVPITVAVVFVLLFLQPPGPPGSGPVVCRPDLSLYRHYRRGDHRRPGPGSHQRPAHRPTCTPPGRSRSGPIPGADSSWGRRSSSCSRPSPTAGPR